MATERLTGRDVFELLRPDQIHAVSETAEEVSFRAGDTVFRRDDSADYFFIVLEGQVELRLPSKEGVSVLIDEADRGVIFGSCICFQIDSYTLTARCSKDSKLLKIRATTLKKQLDDNPVLGYAVQMLISRIYFNRYIETAQKLQAMLQTIPIKAI